MINAMKATLRGVARETLIFTVAAFLPYVAMPVIAHAQESFDPLSVSDGVRLHSGIFRPLNPDAFTLPKEQVCTIVIEDWGWSSCVDVDALIVGPSEHADNVLFEVPNRDGYIKPDEWTDEAAKEMIEHLSASLRESAKVQGERTGEDVRFIGWRVKPTLDRENGFLYYATDWTFDGHPTMNISSWVLDRRGYIPMNIVPRDSDLGVMGVRELIVTNLASYEPNVGESYSSFVAGDKVAAVGALGLLGTFFGVKYGKAAAGGIIAIALAFAKKFFIIIPLVALGALGALWGAIKRLFVRHEGSASEK